MDHIFMPLRRIILLQGLEAAPGWELSNEMLQRLLMANGQRCSLAEVNEQITWLEHRGYVKTTRLDTSGFILVHLTRPGIEVATGLARAAGIDPPPRGIRMGQKSAVDRLLERLRTKLMEMLHNPTIT